MAEPTIGATNKSEGADAGVMRSDFRLGDWVVRPSLDQIERNGDVVHLQHLSMRVLCFLVERGGTVVSYDELLEALWQGRAASEDAVHRRIADLRQNLGDDARSPRYIETIVKQGYRITAPVVQIVPTPRTRWRWAAGGTLLAAVFAYVLVLNFSASPPPDAIDAAESALAEDDYERAYDLVAEYLDRHPDDPDLQAIAEALLIDIRLETEPTPAQVAIRPYGNPAADWKEIGTTPLEHSLPRGTWQVRLSAPGRETLELALPNPSRAFNNGERPLWVFELPEAGSVPEGMIYVPPMNTMIPIIGLRRIEDLGGFHIDRTEVSNGAYQEFVDAGGYEHPEYWSALGEADPPLTFSDVARLFHDADGLPGPSTWRNGHYPEGTADLPVTGVSYYEAMAYAEFHGRKLPTARHWARAALGIGEQRWPVARALVPAAHLSGTTPVPVTEGQAISTWGALHLVGNAREWTRDYSGPSRLSPGSGFMGPSWGYALPGATDPLSRTHSQGFRLAQYDEAKAPMPIAGEVVPRLPEVSDETFTGIISQLHYPAGSIGAEDAEQVYERPEGDWLRRKVILPAEDPSDPLPVLLFLPKHPSGPLQPVIYLPPGDSYDGGYPSEEIDITRYDIDFLVREGMALVWPVYWGTHDRFRGHPPEGSARQMRGWQVAIDQRRNEMGRVIDYLEDSPEFDASDVSLMAVSFGGTFFAAPLLAAEERLKSAVLIATGLAPLHPERIPLHLNPNTYWPRVTQPVLLLNGRFDLGFGAGTETPAILEVLGTSSDHKRAIAYPVAHWPMPARLLRRDVLIWMADRSGDTGTTDVQLPAGH